MENITEGENVEDVETVSKGRYARMLFPDPSERPLV